MITSDDNLTGIAFVLLALIVLTSLSISVIGYAMKFAKEVIKERKKEEKGNK